MSVLGHYLEAEGLATTIISLVRLHSETTQPPRSLYVPFELGRPLGSPNDPILQRRVLESALALLELDDGPYVLSDFEISDDVVELDQNWVAPSDVPVRIDLSDVDGVLKLLQDEVSGLKPAYYNAKALRGRTTVGIAQLSMAKIALHMASFLNGPHENSPRDDLSAAMVLRFGADDLKAYYYEAGAAFGQPSSWQLGTWFWRNTVAGQILIALRAAALESDDKRFQIVCSSFVVPRIWAAELEL